MKYIEEAEEAAILSGDSLWIVKSMRVKGQILSVLGRNVEAVKILDAVLPLARRLQFDTERLHIEFWLAETNLFIGRYDRALMQFSTSHRLARDAEYLVASLNCIGLTYYKLDDFDNALKFYLAAIDSADALGTYSYFIETNVALCYAYKGDFSAARCHLQNSVEKCGVDCEEWVSITNGFTSGVIAMLEGDVWAAERHFLTSYELSRAHNDLRFQFDNIDFLAEIYIKERQFEKAKAILVYADSVLSDGYAYNLEKIKMYSRLYQYYQAVNMPSVASRYQNQYIAIHDSFYNRDLINSLMKAEADFAERENKAKIAMQEKLLAINSELLIRQKKLNVLSWLVVSLASGIIFFLVKTYRRNKRLNALLDERVKERTKELEVSRKELFSSLKLQVFLVKRVLDGTLKHINTIRGLCKTALLDPDGAHVPDYFNRIDKASIATEEYLKAIMNDDAAFVHDGV